MTAFSRLSRFGMTYKPLMETRGEELLTLYRAAFHVQTSAQREKAQESMEKTQDSGEKWRGSFVKYDPDSSLWITHQCSLLGGLDEFLETWPQWGLMRDGECWEQQMLAQTIRGTESGLSEKLPTPTASDYKSQPTSKSWKAKGAINFKLSNPEIQAKWPTPTAHMAKETNAPSEHKRNTPTLTAQVNWATPTVCGNYNRKGASKTSGDGLATQVGGKLNPMWVEWLMGWPLGWTDLKPLETDRFQSWQQQHSEFFQEQQSND
jgi:hypothetical protein